LLRLEKLGRLTDNARPATLELSQQFRQRHPITRSRFFDELTK
jgi:hypothetical protein